MQCDISFLKVIGGKAHQEVNEIFICFWNLLITASQQIPKTKTTKSWAWWQNKKASALACDTLQNGKGIRPRLEIMKWIDNEKSPWKYQDSAISLCRWLTAWWLQQIVGPAACIGKDLQNSWKTPFIIQLETQLTPVGFDLPHKCEQFLLRAVKWPLGLLHHSGAAEYSFKQFY